MESARNTHQFGIPLASENLLTAVDNVVYVQEAVRTKVVRKDPRTVMSPEPFVEHHLSNRPHMHLPVSPATAAHHPFLASILTKMRISRTFGLSTLESYH